MSTGRRKTQLELEQLLQQCQQGAKRPFYTHTRRCSIFLMRKRAAKSCNAAAAESPLFQSSYHTTAADILLLKEGQRLHPGYAPLGQARQGRRHIIAELDTLRQQKEEEWKHLLVQLSLSPITYYHSPRWYQYVSLPTQLCVNTSITLVSSQEGESQFTRCVQRWAKSTSICANEWESINTRFRFRTQ